MCDQRILVFVLKQNDSSEDDLVPVVALSHNNIFETKKTKKSLAREISLLYPSPLLMKNSSQLHLHSGKKLMAFGYK